jgi:flagellar basal body-associated protein FliL
MNQVLIIIIIIVVVVIIIVIAATVISTAVTGQSNRPVSSPDDQPCRTPVPNSRSPPDPLLAQRRTVSTVPSASDPPHPPHDPCPPIKRLPVRPPSPQ